MEFRCDIENAVAAEAARSLEQYVRRMDEKQKELDRSYAATEQKIRRFIEEIKEERDKFFKMCRFKEVVFWMGMLCSVANLVLLIVWSSIKM